MNIKNIKKSFSVKNTLFYLVFVCVVFLVIEIVNLQKSVDLLSSNNKFLSTQIANGDLKKMKFATPKLKKFQEIKMEYMKMLDEVLTKNGVEYVLEGGTLLGAIRHGGFVPWDDDIDFLVLRDCSKAYELAHKYEIPVDGIAKIDMNCIHYFDPTKIKEIQKHRKIGMIFSAFRHVPGLKKLSQYWTDLGMKKYSTQQKTNVVAHNGYIGGRHTDGYAEIASLGKIYVENFAFPLKRVDFEGYQLSIPSDPDRFLMMQYGNYEGLPRDFGLSKHSKNGTGLYHQFTHKQLDEELQKAKELRKKVSSRLASGLK